MILIKLSMIRQRKVIKMYVFDNDQLKRKLEELKISQKDFSRMIHCTECAVSHYLKGDRTPRLSRYFKICEVLNLQITDLIIRL